jgi:hypothetical protein
MDGAVRHLPVGRILAVDERGIGMRCTWHLERGFINLSLWRGDVCVETFHLTPGDAAKLASFLVTGLAEAVEAPMLAAAAAPPPSRWTRLRQAIARRLAA